MQSRSTWAVALAAAVFGACAVPALADAPATAPQDRAAPPATTAQPGNLRGHDLLTPEERAAYGERLRATTNPEERQKVRDEMRATVEARAREKGIALPPPRESRGGPGERRDAQGAPRIYGGELMSPDERKAYAEQIRAAPTPEARAKLRDEHVAAMQKRAQEKGVTLPEPRAPRADGGRGGRPGGTGDGPRALGS